MQLITSDKKLYRFSLSDRVAQVCRIEIVNQLSVLVVAREPCHQLVVRVHIVHYDMVIVRLIVVTLNTHGHANLS